MPLTPQSNIRLTFDVRLGRGWGDNHNHLSSDMIFNLYTGGLRKVVEVVIVPLERASENTGGYGRHADKCTNKQLTSACGGCIGTMDRSSSS